MRLLDAGTMGEGPAAGAMVFNSLVLLVCIFLEEAAGWHAAQVNNILPVNSKFFMVYA